MELTRTQSVGRTIPPTTSGEAWRDADAHNRAMKDHDAKVKFVSNAEGFVAVCSTCGKAAKRAGKSRLSVPAHLSGQQFGRR